MKSTRADQNLSLRNARRLLRFLAKKKETISPLLILAHNFPDPDCLASTYALHYLVKRFYGIEARIVYGGSVGRTENREMIRILEIPIRKLRVGELKKYEHVALLDTQPEFENNEFPKRRQATLVIDQHQSLGKPNAELAIIDTECGATSVILVQALLALRADIPQKIATALAYGILSDTMDLYRAKRPDVSKTYLEIIRHSDLKALARIQNPTRSRRFFATLGSGIQNAVMCRGLVVSHLGVIPNPDLVAQVAEFVVTYEKAKWSLCTGRYHDKLYVSFRMTKTTTAMAGDILRDVIERRGNAGGHGSIAGGNFRVGHSVSEEIWREKEIALVERLIKRLRIPAKAHFYSPFSNGRT